MGLRDRFFTPATARAIMSWRLAVGAAVVAIVGVAGGPWLIAALAGIAVYGASVAIAMPNARRSPQIDPFALGEPWRQIVQGSQSAVRKLRTTVDGASAGPLKQKLHDIATQVERGVAEVWEVAQRGNDIDRTVRHLDPTALRSKLATLEQRQSATPSPEGEAAVESVRRQIATAERLSAKSSETATKLQLNQTRLDELVARAAEVRVGAAEPDTYARDVEDLIVQLEALHGAVAETHGLESPSP
ncbi:MAG TPA: hypothetical protein VMM60_04765 [Ilumatobacter sp.]|nr:hypothetical protein [Ilumatobacter sp.]